MVNEYDYLIIGSGIAGLTTAIKARAHGSVLILTKGRIDDCNTRYAQGGIAAAIGQGDSTDLHIQDTLAAGAALCDPEAVKILAREGPERIADLIHEGVPFDTTHGEIVLAREGAHTVPRVLHAGGDATGQHIELTLARSVSDAGVPVVEYTVATRLLVEKDTVVGVETLEASTGQSHTFRGRFVMLATGGAGRAYSHTTNPEVATGDGVALAFRAGAQVMDMEFFQFHPTALRLEGAPTFLISEAMRGEGAILRNVQGRPFMAGFHPMADLAPRDLVSRAVFWEMRKSGSSHVLLDVTHIPGERVKARFPTIYRTCLEHGLDITTSPIPVAPAAHYMMGGVKTNTWGETSLKGLYAAGEVACAAVHGANRLASNSLLDTSVFAHRMVERTLSNREREDDTPRPETVVPLGRRADTTASVPSLSLSELQTLMETGVGLVRNATRLEEAAELLCAWDRSGKPQDCRPSAELANLVLVGRLITEAALLRRESRGAHFREDYPETSPDWLKHIVLVDGDGVG